jgi:hypothetical protein
MATVLGFAVNIVTIVMIVVLGIKQKVGGREAHRSFAQVLEADLVVILKGFEKALENYYNETCRKLYLMFLK